MALIGLENWADTKLAHLDTEALIGLTAFGGGFTFGAAVLEK